MANSLYGICLPHVGAQTFWKAKDRKEKRFNQSLTCPQRPGHAPHKDGLAGVQGLRAVHHKVTVTQVPGADLDLDRGNNRVMKHKTKILQEPLKNTCILFDTCERGSKKTLLWWLLTGLSLMVGLDTHR